MEHQDRAFVVKGFRSEALGLTLVAVGAHFPHSGEWGALREAIADVSAAAGTSNVLFMADTNTNSGSGAVFAQLGVAADSLGEVRSTDLHRTCCNTARGWGFVFYFDRVVANFGKVMHTNLLFSPLPEWAKQDENEFHKGVIGDLYIY